MDRQPRFFQPPVRRQDAAAAVPGQVRDGGGYQWLPVAAGGYR
jgi:hypothetical protein